MNELVRFTIAAFERHEHPLVQRVMDVVNDWLTIGDDDVQELAIVGFIEDLSNGNMHENTSREDFLPFMSARLKAEWFNMIEAWEGRAQRLN